MQTIRRFRPNVSRRSAILAFGTVFLVALATRPPILQTPLLPTLPPILPTLRGLPGIRP